MEIQKNFELYTADTINNVDLTYLKYLLNNILEKLNKKCNNRELIFVGLDRVQKVMWQKMKELNILLHLTKEVRTYIIIILFM